MYMVAKQEDPLENKTRIALEKARQLLEKKREDTPFVKLFTHHSLSVELYQPVGHDGQSPHRRDEVYVVVSGRGIFFCDGERVPFEVGDFLFVPAGIEHRFETFTPDFCTWVIFYGPDEGEANHFYSRNEIEGRSFEISTDPTCLDMDLIVDFLQTSYWAKGRSREAIEKAIHHSIPFGLYENGQQVGFARVLTDRITFAYLADVFILDSHRKLGLSKWMMEVILNYHPEGYPLRFLLMTRDAHGLYRQFGFDHPEQPEMFMEKRVKKG